MLENIVIVERVLLIAIAIAMSSTIFLEKPGRPSAKAALLYLIAFGVALVVLSLFPLSMQVDILFVMIVFPVVLRMLQRGQYQNVPFWKRRAPRGQSGFSNRADGLRQTLGIGSAFAPSGSAMAWTYTPTGLSLTQSDPYTGAALAANSNVSARNLLATTYQYNKYDQPSTLTMPNGATYSSMAYDPEGELAGYGIGMLNFSSGSTYATSAQVSYNVRGELIAQEVSSASATETPISQTYEYDAPVGLGSIDPITGAVEPSGCSFDKDGRVQTCQNISPSYDAENHITAAGQLCLSSCVTQAYAWGPSGNTRTFTTQACPTASTCGSYEYTFHWDGNQLLFTTDPNGALVQLNIEELAFLPSSGLSNFGKNQCASIQCVLNVVDRDVTGYSNMTTQNDMHQGENTGGTDVAPNYVSLTGQNKLTGQVVGTYPGAGNGTTEGLGVSVLSDDLYPLSFSRGDGYQLGFYTFQGPRAVNAASLQWMSPDGFPGTLNDPLSQRAYTWVGNNPVSNFDPSGYLISNCPPGEICDQSSPGTYQFFWAGQGGFGGTGELAAVTPNINCANALRIAHQDEGAVARVNNSWSTIASAATAHGIDPNLLAAIGVRESGFQNIPEISGGPGMGVFQLTLGPGVTVAQARNLNWAANYAKRGLPC